MESDMSSDPAVQLERRRMPYSVSGSSAGRAESFTRPDSEVPPRTSSPKPEEQRKPKSKKGHFGPRTCRICFDTEHPRFPSNVSSTLGISTASSRPTYESDDPELGRLLSPCKCKGSAKYVHEGCLNAWRLTNPLETKNFWQCPTCKFNYRLARLHWATKLSSDWAQLVLTVAVFMISIFILGFIADPVLDLWFDPIGSIANTVSSVVMDPDAVRPSPYQEPTTWLEHFNKGFFSLGLIGAFKSFIAMGPWHWINFRAGGLFGYGRRGGRGRNRAESFSLLFVAIGTFTFVMALWQFINTMSARVLTQASNKVMDVGYDDDDDDDDDDNNDNDNDDKEQSNDGS